MATLPSGSEPHGDPSPVIARLRKQRIVAVLQIRKRRKPLIAIGAPAQEPIQQSASPRVVLQSDFVNIVEGPSGSIEIEVTRDADGRMRFWVPA